MLFPRLLTTGQVIFVAQFHAAVRDYLPSFQQHCNTFCNTVSILACSVKLVFYVMNIL